MSLLALAFVCLALCGTSRSVSPPSACFPDGTLQPAALPQNPPLWSPSVNLNITITGITNTEESALKLAFDQALVVAAAFNHDLGYRTLLKAYEAAALYSSSFQCFMCLWALAYLSSPNINRNCASERLVNAQTAMDRATEKGCLDIQRDLERDLMAAMVARFPANRTSSNGATLDQIFAYRMAVIATQTM